LSAFERHFEERETIIDGQKWMVSWHGAGPSPQGKDHGAAGLCVTDTNCIVLITLDGEHWEVPGGRPEPGENAEETLRREMMEEACVRVVRAKLIGYSRGTCLDGHEAGLILVRSCWRAEVDLDNWAPRFETKDRKIVSVAQALELLCNDSPYDRVYRRWFAEAQLV